jgi:hypothetical protein
MNCLPTPRLTQLVFRAFLVALCVPVALGTASRWLLPAQVGAGVFAAADDVRSQLPPPATLPPEESTSEAPDSNKPSEEEVAALALRRKNPQLANGWYRIAEWPVKRWQRLPNIATCRLTTSLHSDQHSVNGCGAPLRC